MLVFLPALPVCSTTLVTYAIEYIRGHCSCCYSLPPKKTQLTPLSGSAQLVRRRPQVPRRPPWSRQVLLALPRRSGSPGGRRAGVGPAAVPAGAAVAPPPEIVQAVKLGQFDWQLSLVLFLASRTADC